MNEKIKAGIIGATSFTGRELISLLIRHPNAEIAWLTSRSHSGKDFRSIYPRFSGALPQSRCILADLEKIEPDSADVVFSCLPHGQSARSLAPFITTGKARVIDFSADFRLRDLAVFEKTYGVVHPLPGSAEASVYGLPELFEDNIRTSRITANPGCYPTSILLPLCPLLRSGLIKPEGIIADSKSGVSGAGKTPSEATHFVNCNESFSAYKVGNVHRHLPEIDEQLSIAAGGKIQAVFTPHLLPMERGIFSTIYCDMAQGKCEADIRQALLSFYNGSPFVHVVDHLPSTGEVRYTNNCHIHVQEIKNSGKLIILSVIDNLIKGASGQAVQNMNVMFGFSHSAGLL